MRKKLNKISILFLAFIFLLTLLLGSIKVYAENNEEIVYETLEQYLQENYSGASMEEIEYLYVDGTINDYTGLSTLTNLISLNIYNNTNLSGINFEELPKLEDIYIYNCTLDGTLNFSKNKNLTDIYIYLYGDLSNSIVNIEGMECLEEFEYYYENSSGFDLKKCILMDDYDLLYSYSYEDENGKEYGGNSFCIYESIERYLQKNYADTPREEITELYIDGTVKSYTGLSTLTNLTYLNLQDNKTNLSKINFEELPRLEKVYLSGCTLNGTLDFSKNKNLKDIYISLYGDLSNAVVKIQGMDWLKEFEYNYSESSGFDLKRCILMDDYDLLYSYSYEDENGKEYGGNSFSIYESIEAYLQENYSDTPRGEITDLYIDGTVRSYTGLSTLTNLTSLTLANNDNLSKINLTEVPKLEEVSLRGKQNGILNFSKNMNLTDIYVELKGDLSNAIVDIRGMDWLEEFEYCYSDSSGFDLKKCILMDDYDILDSYSYEDENGNISGRNDFSIYKSIEAYLQENYSDTPRGEITDLYIYGTVRSYAGLSTLTNLTSLTLSNNINLNGIDFTQVPKLKEVDLTDCKLSGTLDFSKNTMLTDIYIKLKGDLTKAVVNIKGMDWLSDFDYSHYNCIGFELEKCILMDDYSILDHYTYESDGVIEGYKFSLDIYKNIDEFLQDRYPGETKQEIEDLRIYEDAYIRDMSGLSTLTNLTSLYIEGKTLTGLNIEKLSKLESIEIVDCKLDGTIDLSKNSNLTDIYVKLYGDLSNAVVNIKGLKNIQTFKYEYYNSTGFDLKTCILADNYDSFEYSTYKNNNGDNVGVYSKVRTLTEYLIKNGLDTNSDGKLSAEEWKKVKNLDLDGDIFSIKGIENATNLKELTLTNIDPNLIGFSKLSNLEYLNIYIEDKKVDFTFPKMNKLENLYIYGINNLDISKLSSLKDFDCGETDGSITFPTFEKLEYIYCYVKESKLDLSKCKNLEYAGLYGVESIDNITFPKDKFIYAEEDSTWIYIESLEKEISIKKGGTYTFYDMKPTCVANDIIEISTENEYSHTILAKNVGTAKIKLVDSLENEFEITITVTDEKVDTKLENTGVTAQIIDEEMILKSNGELWKINSETTAEKVETNAKKYVWGYVYAKGETQVTLENILKKDNTLSVKIDDTKIENVASNVSDVNDNLYLTTNGDLYELGANYITEEITPKKVLSNVKMITDDCVVMKDGTTWYQEQYKGYYTTNDVTFKKLADFEIRDSRCIEYEFSDRWRYIITVIDSNNNLWCTKSRSAEFDDSGLEKLETNFKAYEENLDNGWRLLLTNGNAVLETNQYNEETGRWDIISSEVILTDVYQIGSSYWSDVIIRKDGTIWLYDETNGLTKITKSTVIEEEKKEEEEKLPFTDVPENMWYYNAVKFTYEQGMIKGTTETTFAPDKDLTRGMLVTILYRMEGSPKVTKTDNFTDVPLNLWYSNAVNWAANMKIVNGYGNGKFGPEDKITREQLAVMLRSYAMYKKKDTSARTDLSKFIDNANISSYAKDSVSWAVANKIISGKSEGTRIDPHGKATRAEVATMLYSYCTNIK